MGRTVGAELTENVISHVLMMSEHQQYFIIEKFFDTLCMFEMRHLLL